VIVLRILKGIEVLFIDADNNPEACYRIKTLKDSVHKPCNYKCLNELT